MVTNSHTAAGSSKLSLARGAQPSAAQATSPIPIRSQILGATPKYAAASQAPKAAVIATAAEPSMLLRFPPGAAKKWRRHRRPTAPPMPSPNARASSAAAAGNGLERQDNQVINAKEMA